jgi:hypothetical protein
VVVGTGVGVVVDTVVGDGELASTGGAVVAVGVQDQEDTVSVVGEVVYRTRYIYHLRASVVVALLVAVPGGMPEERVSLHLEVLGMDADQGGSREGVVVAFVVADTHADPGKDSAGGGVVPAVGWEEAPGSSFVPCLGSTYP